MWLSDVKSDVPLYEKTKDSDWIPIPSHSRAYDSHSILKHLNSRNIIITYHGFGGQTVSSLSILNFLSTL